MRALVLGKNGQVASALNKVVENHCDDWSRSICPENVKLIFADRSIFDLSAPDDLLVKSAIELPACDIVINAAAYTDVDKAESEQELAHAINARAPGFIAMECRNRGIPLIHISTDYVFDGQSQKPYQPDADVNPLSVYGASKAQGERNVQAYSDSLIIRTSGVFSPIHTDFVSTMENLFDRRHVVKVVDNQIMRPTYSIHIAAVILKLAEYCCTKSASGIIHATGNGKVISWKAFAEAILAHQHDIIRNKTSIVSISSEEYNAPARRPAYSVLDMTRLEDEFDISMPDWERALIDRIVHQKLY